MPKRPKPRKNRNVLEIKRPVPLQDGTTGRRSFYGQSLEEAERSWREFLEPPLELRAKAGTFGHTFLTHLLPLKSHLATATIDDLQTTARHLLPELGDMYVRHVTVAIIADALLRIEQKQVLLNARAKDRERNPEIWAPIAPRTVNKCRRLAIEVMSLAAELNPDKVKLLIAKRIPVREEPEKEIQIYTPPMMRRLLEASRGRPCFVPAVLYGFLGLRLREGLGVLTIDLSPAGVLSVKRQAERKSKKTKNKLKTRSSKRDIPLPAGILEELRPFGFGPGRLARNGVGDPLQAANTSTSLARAMRRAGLPLASPHELRHSFSTWLDCNGCPRSVRLALLGQSRKAVQDVYNHADAVSMREWLGKLWDASLIDDGIVFEAARPVLGTRSPNAGESNGRSVLTAQKAGEIRRRGEQETAAALAREFGVSRRTASKIIAGTAWRTA